MTKSLDAGARSGHRALFPSFDSAYANPFNSSRTSVLPSVIIPYLRRLDTDTATFQKAPLLTLKLSSSSFLDSVVQDVDTELALYTIQTDGISTVITRPDPYTKTAEIKWPKSLPSRGKGRPTENVLVQMEVGQWKGAASFLRSGPLASSSRKFNIPGYSKSLKWKQVGSAYWCLAGSVKGPIAILDPASESEPPQLQVFETLHDKYDSQSMDKHRGVSILLLDHLLITSLLLVTASQEWMQAKKPESDVSPITPLTPATAPASSSLSQWQTPMVSEPSFTRRASSPAITLTAEVDTAALKGHGIYGSSQHPFMRASSADILRSELSLLETDDEEDMSDVDEPVSSMRGPSPSMESVLFPQSNGSAPAHTYLDPMFYDGSHVPPVPPLPSEYTTLRMPTNPRSVRGLPRPPQSATEERSLHEPRPASELPPARNNRPVRPVIRTMSVNSRRLPTPPTPTTPGSSVRSPPTPHSAFKEKWPSLNGRRSLPPTPTSAPAVPLSNRDSSTRKDSHDQLFEWTGSPDGHSSRISVIDVPPPAYNSISFSSVTITSHASAQSLDSAI